MRALSALSVCVVSGFLLDMTGTSGDPLLHFQEVTRARKGGALGMTGGSTVLNTLLFSPSLPYNMLAQCIQMLGGGREVVGFGVCFVFLITLERISGECSIYSLTPGLSSSTCQLGSANWAAQFPHLRNGCNITYLRGFTTGNSGGT